MLALRKRTSEHRLELEEIDDPQPGPGEVRVRVRRVGLCGTDLHVMHNRYGPLRLPVTIGHEVVGEVETPTTDGCYRPGDRVAVQTWVRTCGHCRWCLTGRPNLCPGRQSIGSALDGGAARYLVVPERFCVPVDPSVPWSRAVLVEPLACVVQALDGVPGAVGGETALVAGPGAVGLLVAAVLRRLGYEVTVAGRPEDGAGLAVAEEIGVTAATTEELAGPGSRRGWTLGVEASGAPDALDLLVDLVEPGGRVLLLGLGHEPLTGLTLDRLVRRQLTLTGSFGSTPASWLDASALLGKMTELDRLVTEELPLERADEALARVASAQDVKVTLCP